MYNFDNIAASYEFSACVMFADGKKTSFTKVEHIQAKREDEGYCFTFNGSSNEKVNGKDPEDWNAIIIEFGKALYPYSLQVSDHGRLNSILDFDNFKEHWMTRRREIVEYYECNFPIKKMSYSYSLSLKTEKKFLNILRKNLFYRLLFWQDDQTNQEIEIRDFPGREKFAIFSFDSGIEENGEVVFKTDRGFDDGTYHMQSGNCIINIRRDDDGLPIEIVLRAKVEQQYKGFFTKEVKLRRL